MVWLPGSFIRCLILKGPCLWYFLSFCLSRLSFSTIYWGISFPKHNTNRKKNKKTKERARKIHKLKTGEEWFIPHSQQCFYSSMLVSKFTFLLLDYWSVLVVWDFFYLHVTWPSLWLYRGQTTMWSLHSYSYQGNWIKRSLWFWSLFIPQHLVLVSVCALSVQYPLPFLSSVPPTPWKKRLFHIYSTRL